MERQSGASSARNAGARAARGDILLFVDADTMIQPDAAKRIRAKFSTDPRLGAIMGSYADRTTHRNFVSVYKNLLHHFTHQTSAKDASTFWTGCGAIRKTVFFEVGGFDEDYKSASVEDIELGYRLTIHGVPLRLEKEIQVKHLKRYSFLSLIKSDLFCRSIPWTKIMLRKKIFKNDLNTKSYNVFSVFLSYLSLLFMGAAMFYSFFLACLPPLVVLFIWLNRGLLLFMKRKQGWLFAFKSAWMVYFGYLYSGLGFWLGVGAYLREK